MQMRLGKWVCRVPPTHVHTDDISQEGPEDTALHTQRGKIHARTIQTSLKSVLEQGPGQRRRYCFGSGLPDPDRSRRQSPRRARLVGEQARPEWSSEPCD